MKEKKVSKVFCQSCAMPLDKPKDFGTNADGSRNDEYCHFCFEKSKFTNQNITMAEMLKIGLKGIDENTEMSKPMKFMIKKMYPAQLKKMKRWIEQEEQK
jgi:hypothetical protein